MLVLFETAAGYAIFKVCMLFLFFFYIGEKYLAILFVKVTS